MAAAVAIEVALDRHSSGGDERASSTYSPCSVFQDGLTYADRRSEVASPGSDTTIIRKAPESPVGPFLTANDIRNPSPAMQQKVHERSQDALLQVCQHRGLRAEAARVPWVADPYSDEPHARERAVAVQVLQQIYEQGIHALRRIRVALHDVDDAKNGICSAQTWAGTLSHLGICLTPKQTERIQELFRPATGPANAISYARLLAHGYSNWSETREDAVKEAFSDLSSCCPGSILSLEAMERRFHPEALLPRFVPELTDHEHECFHTFHSQWNLGTVGADGLVSWLEFMDYYLDVSVCIGADKDFCQYVCASWGFNVDDWLAKRLFQSYSGGGKEDNSLSSEDFLCMIKTLDHTITIDEGMAWFRAMDEDGSGEVSLEEFLESQVLKVKRLFDIFDVAHKRVVTKDQMIQILRSLNPDIDEVEAGALYQYADLDGNGEVSFTEFLENHLLQMLKLFDDFNGGHHTRCITEVQAKSFLHQLDPSLDHFDIHALYKAIDPEHTGNISFVKLVESHALRAKMLFHRHDVAGWKALTALKFRDLMHDLDAGLSEDECDAIYELVREPSDGKVHFSGFFNPNIVKMKLLFTKHDKQQRRVLSPLEFHNMLSELFKDATDKDLEELEKIIPFANRDVTLIEYIRRYKDMARAYESLQLSKRRKAREKAARLTAASPPFA